MKTGTILLIGGLLVAASAGGTYFAMSHNGYSHARMSQMHGHGADGTGHDEVNMPGLRGENATAAESAEIATLFRAFETLTPQDHHPKPDA